MAAAISDEEVQNKLVEDTRQLIQDICDEHISAVDLVIKDPVLRKTLSHEIQQECHELADYIAVTKRFNLEVNSRSKDRVVSFGEKLSGRFMTAVLRDRVRRLFSCRMFLCWRFSCCTMSRVPTSEVSIYEGLILEFPVLWNSTWKSACWKHTR